MRDNAVNVGSEATGEGADRGGIGVEGVESGTGDVDVRSSQAGGI